MMGFSNDNGYGRMMENWGWDGWLVGLIFVLIIIALIVIVVIFLNKPRRQYSNISADSAIEIAKTRYAKGGITKDEFEKLRDHLKEK